MNDSLSKTSGKAVSESLSLSDGVTVIKGKLLTLAIESFSLVEAFGKSAGKSVSESFSLVEAFGKSAGKSVSESFAMVETFGKSAGKFVSESFSLVEAFGKSAGKAFSELFSLFDLVAELKSIVLGLYGDVSRYVLQALPRRWMVAGVSRISSIVAVVRNWKL